MLTGFPSVYPDVQEASSKGRLPWSVDGLSEGLDYIDQHGNEGANHFAIQFLNRKYGWERAFCHSWRLSRVMKFWHDFRDRLIEVKLIIPGASLTRLSEIYFKYSAFAHSQSRSKAQVARNGALISMKYS